jgi:hypothetical protein
MAVSASGPSSRTEESSKQILFVWTSDLALVRFREIDDVPTGPYEALFRPDEWTVVQAVGHLKQLTDVGAVEKAHGIAGHAIDIYEGLSCDYGGDRTRYAPERVDRLFAGLRAEWVAAGRGVEVDRPTYASHHEFWAELQRRLNENPI